MHGMRDDKDKIHLEQTIKMVYFMGGGGGGIFSPDLYQYASPTPTQQQLTS